MLVSAFECAISFCKKRKKNNNQVWNCLDNLIVLFYFWPLRFYLLLLLVVSADHTKIKKCLDLFLELRKLLTKYSKGKVQTYLIFPYAEHNLIMQDKRKVIALLLCADAIRNRTMVSFFYPFQKATLFILFEHSINAFVSLKWSVPTFSCFLIENSYFGSLKSFAYK